jgi:hypothetical protein
MGDLSPSSGARKIGPAMGFEENQMSTGAITIGPATGTSQNRIMGVK